MQPPPDAVSEFRVVTNNQSAEYGRAAGATVNVAYRSGTNQIHGDGWEFFRDTALNADSYFKPADGSKPPLRRNQYGGTMGGPLVQNKAFFFGDFEGFRQDKKATAFSTLPSSVQSSGILTVDIRDPRTGVIYPAGTQIPMTALARRVLGGLPAPNVASAANNYSIAQDFTNDTDKAGGKIDLQISPTLSMFGRYGWRSLSTTDQPPIPLPSGGGGNGNIYTRNKQLVLGTTCHAEQHVAARSALRLVEHAGRQEPAGARLDGRLRHHRAADRPAHRRRPAVAGHHRLLGVRPAGDQPAVAVPDGVEPEGQLLVADGPPVAQGRATSSSTSTSRCRT